MFIKICIKLFKITKKDQHDNNMIFIVMHGFIMDLPTGDNLAFFHHLLRQQLVELEQMLPLPLILAVWTLDQQLEDFNKTVRRLTFRKLMYWIQTLLGSLDGVEEHVNIFLIDSTFSRRFFCSSGDNSGAYKIDHIRPCDAEKT